ncbi:MAG: hypothetical protein JRN15_14545 [Nitrososphaerota archaeon]|nr:hypothetical protein [Nitrososphaerota archaeon]
MKKSSCLLFGRMWNVLLSAEREVADLLNVRILCTLNGAGEEKGGMIKNQLV